MDDDALEMTLDPPGRIAVIGAGPLGLEAALYGRFLGYDVHVLQRGQIGGGLWACGEAAAPVKPSECLSPLAWSALQAQFGAAAQAQRPTTIEQWAQALQRLAKSDLLSGRVHGGREVTAIELIDVEAEPVGGASQPADPGSAGVPVVEADERLPADFRLHHRCSGPLAEPVGGLDEPLDCEALIVATGAADDGRIAGLGQCSDSPYCFRLSAEARALSDGERRSLAAGWREITRIFAQLGGRPELDLYRPPRL